MKLNSLPTGYITPSSLEIGTNKLNNVTAILEVSGNIPLLIGDGKKPRIWLYIPADKDGNEWYPLIKDNFSTNSSVLVVGDKTSTSIATKQGNIITCKKRADGVIEVSKVDLTLIGLNFVADKSSVKFMNNTFSGNTFSNVGVMFGSGNA